MPSGSRLLTRDHDSQLPATSRTLSAPASGRLRQGCEEAPGPSPQACFVLCGGDYGSLGFGEELCTDARTLCSSLRAWGPWAQWEEGDRALGLDTRSFLRSPRAAVRTAPSATQSTFRAASLPCEKCRRCHDLEETGRAPSVSCGDWVPGGVRVATEARTRRRGL